MKRFMGKLTILTVVAVPVIALFSYAWIDGGREPVREIVQSVPVPKVQQ